MDELEEYNSTNSNQFLKKLQNSSKEDMMELIYNSIVESKMGALKHNGTINDKIEGVQSVLNFFLEREAYEKCLELKKIIIKLKTPSII
jgi:hypothetical protein